MVAREQEYLGLGVRKWEEKAKTKAYRLDWLADGHLLGIVFQDGSGSWRVEQVAFRCPRSPSSYSRLFRERGCPRASLVALSVRVPRLHELTVLF